jgi:hypothetical protein
MTPLTIFVLKLIAGALVSLTVGGGIKGLLWFREVKTNHLPHIQAAAEEARDAAQSARDEIKTIPIAIEKQTTAIVNELREQRQDIRNLTLTMKL